LRRLVVDDLGRARAIHRACRARAAAAAAAAMSSTLSTMSRDAN
jgi:hypothetical protein